MRLASGDLQGSGRGVGRVGVSATRPTLVLQTVCAVLLEEGDLTGGRLAANAVDICKPFDSAAAGQPVVDKGESLSHGTDLFPGHESLPADHHTRHHVPGLLCHLSARSVLNPNFE